MFTWTDFQCDTNLEGSDAGNPDLYYIIINDPDGEEYALICHRITYSPLDSNVAKRKERDAQHICDALNAQL